MDYQEKVNALFEDQKLNWPLLRSNWEQLKSARLRKFDFDGFSIKVQCNPKRIISSAAKVDKESIEKRQCFLCLGNRPPEEHFVSFENEYEILCNPFPIFSKHFTIAKTEHTPQVIEHEFPGFLQLSKELHDLVVFYNAPGCGASAPDHMHFQAGILGFMPIEKEIGMMVQKYGRTLFSSPDLSVTAIEDSLRRFIVLESENMDLLSGAFTHLIRYMKALNGEEPMINMLGYYRNKWQVFVFPRARHRPWQYFEEGEKNILLSPASVDMGGLLITPLEKDFNKISKRDIEDIFSQVSFSVSQFDDMTKYLNAKLQIDA